MTYSSMETPMPVEPGTSRSAFYDEELVKALQIPLLSLLEKLSLLELKGIVSKDKQGKWQIKN